MQSERRDTLKLCQDVTSALCTNLSRRDRILIKEFFVQLAGPPDCVSVERIGSTVDNDQISAVTYEAKFGFFVTPEDFPIPLKGPK